MSSKDSKCLGTVWYNYDALLRLDDYRAPFYGSTIMFMPCRLLCTCMRSLEKLALLVQREQSCTRMERQSGQK